MRQDGANSDWLACSGRRLARRPGVGHFARLFLPVASLAFTFLLTPLAALATPANKTALVKYYGPFLASNLNSCATCHLPTKLDHPPESLDEFPHNPFGDRLRILGKQLKEQGKARDIPSRLALIAKEDADSDGVSNEIEILLGRAPGDSKDKPTGIELATLPKRQRELTEFLQRYRWEPFQSVKKPAVPALANTRVSSHGHAASLPIRNPIDAFVSAEHKARGLTPRPEASKQILLRRVYLDLIGLTPTLEEQRDFAADQSPAAYDKLVDRLLDDPRYGERWGRHWMDIWRYSDWAGWADGNQIRDSKPHIWRWRDWIIESLNADKGYDRMVLEMLAADEIAPTDPNALRATGFLARNFKLLSREQWMEDTLKHTSQAFLGVTVGCAKCHNHMFDPISQKDYYQMRAIFEPHQVRTDRIAGELDLSKNGLVRVFDSNTNGPTYLFIRGDERRPDTNQIMQPGVPASLCGLTAVAASGGKLETHSISLPRLAAHPDRRDFVAHDTIAAAEREVEAAQQKFDKSKSELARISHSATNDVAHSQTNLVSIKRKTAEFEAGLDVAQTKLIALRKVIAVEAIENTGEKNTAKWRSAAHETVVAQRDQAVAEAAQKLLLAKAAETDAQAKVGTSAISGTADKPKTKESDKAAKDLEAAKKNTSEAEKALADAKEALEKEPTTVFKPRPTDDYPETSSGRRLAFAQWLSSPQNPLTARVAVNHIWLRHFGRGLVPTPNDFGANGRPASHPALLDWLAAELMADGWSMKKLHRLMVTSSAYRMASTPNQTDAKIDPDNVYLWRMGPHRMEAELVRDNLLYLGGNLDLTMGGPEIDHKLGLTSTRRSVYLRTAAEKEVEFLKIFDNASVTECYMRKPSVMPQQALALANSEVALRQAEILSAKLVSATREDRQAFVTLAFEKILARPATPAENRLCLDFLEQQPALKTTQHSSAVRKVSTAGTARESTGPTGSTDSKRARDLILVLFNHNDFVSIR